MSMEYVTQCLLCGEFFKAKEDAKSEELKAFHMASKHPGYELVRDWGWRKRSVKPAPT